MELLLILTYVAICFAIFKIFRIPVNEWTLSTAALGGIVGLFMLLISMNYNHPFTTNARIYYPVTPVLPTVRGRVTDVPVQSNTPLKQGDVLFRIDPRPYQYAVDQLTAEVEKAKVELTRTQIEFERQKTLVEKQSGTQTALDNATRDFDAAKDLLKSASSRLDNAQYELDQTVTTAPGNGFVTQLALRPGMYVVPAPLRPVMVFVNTDKGDMGLGAAFQQNSLQRVKAGNEAEIAFDAVPGRVFKGKVRVLIDAIAAGQYQAIGTLVDVDERKSGRALAMIDIVDDISGYQIPLGAAAQVAIYTEHLEKLSLLRKILLRMRSWENFVYSEEHGGGGH
jgi:multidrug resistance efflux pump